MKRGIDVPRLALALVSLAGVGLVFALDLGRTSPGPLSAVHARAPALAEGRRCSACHGGVFGSLAGACLDCHAPVAADIAAERGLHGRLAPDARDCGRCHSEHHGPEAPLAGARSFLAAGIAARERYDHADLGFELAGAHADLACAECHANADVAELARGERRFGGLDPDCRSCHADVHDGRMARSCSACHDPEQPFALAAAFQHERFDARCAHGQAACVDCHPRGSARSVETEAGRSPPAGERGCADCHAAPHAPGFLAGAAVLGDVAEAEVCAACHDEEHTGFAGHAAAMPTALHAASGFALAPPHAERECADCHRELRGDVIVDFAHRERAADDCGACHADPHAGQFADGPSAEACVACHARERFTPVRFGLAEHAATAFPLEGSHQAVACERCHARESPESSGAPRRFAGTPQACATCHADAHRGAFAGLAEAQGCASCHQATLFGDVHAFDHGRATGFALDGGHGRAECEACHVPSSAPDERGRSFGFVAGRAEQGCARCHADVHDGAFGRAEVPRAVAGKTGCARCHTTDSFAEFDCGGFDHELWTGYPLMPEHARLECAACHPSSADAAGGVGERRHFGRSAGTACADCHEDPHVGQFARDGATDCARCHADGGELRFDHGRDARFALDGTHAELDCAACHRPWPLEGGGEAVRFKPLGTECADCHAEGASASANTEVPR